MKTKLLVAAALGLVAAAPAQSDTRTVAPVETVYTDARGNRILSVWRDPETGCEYLLGVNEAVPRLKPDGLPLCRPPAG